MVSLTCGGHDGSLTIALGGEILAVLQLERLFNRRFYDPCQTWKIGGAAGMSHAALKSSGLPRGIQDEWRRAFEATRAVTEASSITRFDVGVIFSENGPTFPIAGGGDVKSLLPWPVV